MHIVQMSIVSKSNLEDPLFLHELQSPMLNWLVHIRLSHYLPASMIFIPIQMLLCLVPSDGLRAALCAREENGMEKSMKSSCCSLCFHLKIRIKNELRILREKKI
jgi:hypothetical protein